MDPGIGKVMTGKQNSKTSVLYECASKHVTWIRAGRDAGPHRDMVATGLRARHSYVLDSALADIPHTMTTALVIFSGRLWNLRAKEEEF